MISKNKYDTLKNGIINSNNEKYTLNDLLDESNDNWEDQEWGFPKGRRNYKEKDITTGIREFIEETGINSEDIKIIRNIKLLKRYLLDRILNRININTI